MRNVRWVEKYNLDVLNVHEDLSTFQSQKRSIVLKNEYALEDELSPLQIHCFVGKRVAEDAIVSADEYGNSES